MKCVTGEKLEAFMTQRSSHDYEKQCLANAVTVRIEGWLELMVDVKRTT